MAELAKNQNNPLCHLRLAQFYEKSSDPAVMVKALKHYDEILRIAPGHLPHYSKACVNQRLGNASQARQDCSQAVGLLQTQINMGISDEFVWLSVYHAFYANLLAQKDRLRAAEYCTEAIKGLKGDARIPLSPLYARRGILRHELNSIELAEADCLAVVYDQSDRVNGDEDRAAAYRILYIICKQRDGDGSASLADKYIEDAFLCSKRCDPREYCKYLMEYIEHLYAKQDYGAVMELLAKEEARLESLPDNLADMRIRFRYVAVKCETNIWEREHKGRVIKRNDERDFYRHVLAYLESNEDFEDNLPDFYYNLSNAYYKLERYRDAFDAFGRISGEIEKLEPKYHILLAKLYHYYEDGDNELRLLTSAVDKLKSGAGPHDAKQLAEAFYLRGVFHYDNSKYDDAKADLESAVKADSGNGQYYEQLGKVCFCRYNGGIRSLMDAMEAYSIAKSLYEGQGISSKGIDNRIFEIGNLLMVMGYADDDAHPRRQICRLLRTIYMDGISLEAKREAKRLNTFIQERKQSRTGEPEPGMTLTVLKRWNSYTPILERDHNTSKGGGYFLQVNGIGIAIDPGLHFISNFKANGFYFHQIDHVIITHNHIDHTSDLEPLLTLLHEYNESILGDYDSPEPGTVMYEVLHTEEHANDPKYEVLMKHIAKKALCGKGNTRYKRLKLHLTINTYFKFATMTKLDEDAYDIMIVKSGDDLGIRCDGLKVLPIMSAHKDLSSDRGSVGYEIAYTGGGNKTLLIYTGDTGYNLEIESQYMEVVDKYPDYRKILLAHLGGFKPNENRFNPAKEYFGEDSNENAFYKNHLGRIGLARLAEVVEPEICLVSEFGEEFTHLRKPLLKSYNSIYHDDALYINRNSRKPIKFFAVDIGFTIDEMCRIKAISSTELNDKRGLQTRFFPYGDVAVTEIPIDNSLHYYDKKIGEDVHGALIKYYWPSR